METRLLNDVGRRESGDDFRVQWWYGCMVVVVSMEHGRRNKDVCVVVLCIRHVMSTQTPGFPPILLCSPPKSIFFSFTWTERVLEGSGWLFEFSFTFAYRYFGFGGTHGYYGVGLPVHRIP